MGKQSKKRKITSIMGTSRFYKHVKELGFENEENSKEKLDNNFIVRIHSLRPE